MERKHSWTWLPSRLTNLQHPEPKSATPRRRPPLAALEQLEDRVLLSASSTGGGTDAILIGLLKGQVDIRTSAVNFLKVVEGICDGTQPELDAFLKITDAFHKIDSAVAALTTDALTSVGHKEDAAGQKFLEIKLQDVIILRQNRSATAPPLPNLPPLPPLQKTPPRTTTNRVPCSGKDP